MKKNFKESTKDPGVMKSRDASQLGCAGIMLLEKMCIGTKKRFISSNVAWGGFDNDGTSILYELGF